MADPLPKTDDVSLRSRAVARLNDALRQSLRDPGHDRVMMTSSVVDFIGDTTKFRGFHRRAVLLRTVRDYDDFGPEVDPYGEHDFGRFELAGVSFYWKIDYYDRALAYGSEDPADPAVTCRVLTIMLVSDY